jgi:NAD(P)H-dependent FMN reductase
MSRNESSGANGRRLAVIIGSVREGRVGPAIAHWFAGAAGQHGLFDIDIVDLADFRLPLDMSRESEHDGDALAARLDEADAFAVVTPEYNHGYPAALKNAIDWTTTQWRAKPVCFVSYGGQSGGSRAVEQLRPVFVETHTMTLRETVSINNPWDEFAPSGLRCDEARWAARAKRLLDQLAWWCTALKDARQKAPYEG